MKSCVQCEKECSECYCVDCDCCEECPNCGHPDIGNVEVPIE